MKTLFICRRNESYGVIHGVKKNSGLFVSTEYVAAGLRRHGITAVVEIAIDGNCVDRIVTEHRPQIVIIEALWVTPLKFKELRRLHPKVQFFVHLHSDVPFLQLEGMAMEWIPQYPFFDVGIITNCEKMRDALLVMLRPEAVKYLPNIYKRRHSKRAHSNRLLDVACFGAIRPFKNQLLQAMAAIRYASEEDVHLTFHMNGTRVEQGGDPILKNIKAVFNHTPRADLMLHPWMDPDQLHELLRHMDLGMQVSMTETFNIVSADYVAAGLPIVVSNSIPWASRFSQVNEKCINSIVRGMRRAINYPMIVGLNQGYLTEYSDDAEERWVKFAQTA